ncbi:hypothetical protein QBC39DRAFT_415900 [Podospora conica]|nr:hypothetical protein QBC39DRAFT_415900 [Schizothecium conicum]
MSVFGTDVLLLTWNATVAPLPAYLRGIGLVGPRGEAFLVRLLLFRDGALRVNVTRRNGLPAAALFVPDGLFVPPASVLPASFTGLVRTASSPQSPIPWPAELRGVYPCKDPACRWCRHFDPLKTPKCEDNGCRDCNPELQSDDDDEDGGEEGEEDRSYVRPDPGWGGVYSGPPCPVWTPPCIHREYVGTPSYWRGNIWSILRRMEKMWYHVSVL